MNINTHPHCDNCDKPVDVVVVYKPSDECPLIFCSIECFNEYRTCDGGDDDYLSQDCTD